MRGQFQAAGVARGRYRDQIAGCLWWFALQPEPDPVPAKPKPRAKDKAKAKDKPAGFRFYLKLANGTSVEIEQTSKSDKIITFTEKPTTQVVSLMVKGEVIEVDLVPLRKLDQMAQSDYGMTNAKLLALALAAN